MEDTFPKRIYELVRCIPEGRVATYGQLALLAGSPRAARIVGAVMARAPAGLPCHRVLYRDGSLCCERAITPNGPVFVEGNNLPGYDILQMPPHTPDKVGMLPRFREFVKGI